MLLAGEDVTQAIRENQVSRYASQVSAYPAVRAFLLEMQRNLARTHDVIMDGRDIGTVVLPQADLKIFLTASVEERARRRMLELEERGTPEPYAAILRAIQERDWNDTHPASGGGRGAAGHHGSGFCPERRRAAAHYPGEDGTMSEKRPLNGFFVCIYYLVNLVAGILHPVTIIGRENLPEHGALLCPNHNSNWDPVLVALKVPVNYRLHIMAKKELFCNKVFDWVLRKLGAFPVDRGEGDIEAVKTALKAIKSGDNLLIFPEGTRVEHEGALPAKGGVAVIGIRSGAQFVPVYVEGNKRLFRRTRIIFGQAYRPEATSRRPSPEEVQAIADEVLRRSYALGKEAR